MKLSPAFTLLLAAVSVLASCKPEADPSSNAAGTPAKETAPTSPPKEADYAKLGYSKNVFTDPETKQPFTGIARQKDPDGKLRGEYPFNDGRMHGTVKEWHANGKPSAETEFKNGERHGKNIEWTDDGKLYREREYGPGEKILSEKNHGAAK
jgi:antitoxin component YwqK of YwqJK toxin-antitoxin module